MRVASPSSRLVSLIATATLAATGLVVTGIAAPPAAAEIPAVVQPAPEAVTSDALPTTQIDGVAWTQVISGNTVYVGGKFANARPAGAQPGTQQSARGNLLSYNLATGVLNTGFNPAMNAQVKTMAVSPDGTRLYVGGSFTRVGTVSKNRIAAFDTSTGALLTTFAAGVDYTVNAIEATNSAVYVGGAFNSANGSSRTRLAAFHPTTGALLPWNPTADATVNAMVVVPDGSAVIAGGSFQNVNGSPAYGMAKLDATTAALMPWNATKLIRNAGTNSAILSLSTDGDAIYGSGYHFGAGGNLEGVFSADPTTGDIVWVEDCHGDTYDAWAGNGVVYSVSHAHYCGNVGGFPQTEPWSINMRHALAWTKQATGTAGHDPHGYFDFYGTPAPSLLSWFPEMDNGTYTGKDQAAWSVTGNTDYVVLGGEFPTVNGVRQEGLVRFAVPGIAPKKVGPTLTGAEFNPATVALPSGAGRIAWQANSDKDDHTLTYRLTRDGVEVYTTTADSTFWNRPSMGYLDTAVEPGQTYRYRLSATDKDGNVAQSDIVNFTAPAAGSTSALSQRIVADGAAPYWPLNETSGTTVLDNAGFNDGTIGAGVTRGTAGAVAGDAATTFNGSSTAATRTAIPGPNTYTASVWIKTTTTAGGKILGFGNSPTGNSSNYDRHVYMDSAGRIFFGVHPGGVRTVNSGSSYNDGQWHQITTSLGPDGMKLYVDAKLVGSRGDVTFGQEYSGYWRVGGDNTGGWPGRVSDYFSGAIDEVALYPTVLTRQQINAQWVASGRTSTIPAAPADPYGAAVFNDNPLLFWRLGDAAGTGTAADSGPNGDQTGVVQNGVTFGQPGGVKDGDSAAAFDGSNDLVASTNSFNNPRNYSTEAWFKTTTTNGGKIIGFGASQTGTSNGYDRHVYMSNDGRVTFGTWTGFTNTITTDNALNDGAWHHVVATQSTTEGMKLFVDGALVGTNGQTGAQDYNGYWRIGGDNHWGCCSPFLAGTIDDAAVYQGVLTAAQVANHFNLGNTVVAPNQAPFAEFTSDATYLDATFDATSSNDPDGTVATYAWNFGDGSAPVSGTAAGGLATPSHTFPTTGTYTVTLTVTDNRGESTVITHPISVTAPPANIAPTATFTATTGTLSVSVDASGSADSDGTIASYAWDFGDGTTGTGVTASRTYTAAGNYTVILTVTDDKGATGQATQSVRVDGPANQAPIARFSATTTELTVNLDGTGSSDPDGTVASYAWDFGDGTPVVSGASATHTYASAGMKEVTLTVTDDKNAAHSTTQPVEVTAPPVNQAPVAAFTVTVDGLTANVSSTSTDPDASGSITAWEWTFGDGTGTATTEAAVYSYAAAGNYPITLTVTDNNGATADVTQNVTVTNPPAGNTPPVAGFTVTTDGLSATVTSTSTDSDGTVDAHSWDFGDDTDMASTESVVHTYAAAGEYDVTLTVTDNNGATHAVTRTVTVTAPAPVAMVEDSFGRTTVNGWGSADVGGAWTIAGGNANFGVAGGIGRIRMATAGSGPSATLGAPSSADVSVTMDLTLDKAPTGGGVYVSTAARKVGRSEYRTTAKFLASGAVQVQLVRIVNGASTSLRAATVSGLTYTAGSTVKVRFEVGGTDGLVQLRAKVWSAGGTEPAGWTTTFDDSSAARLTTTGGIALYPYLSGSSNNAPVTASFDNLRVTAMQP